MLRDLPQRRNLVPGEHVVDRFGFPYVVVAVGSKFASLKRPDGTTPPLIRKTDLTVVPPPAKPEPAKKLTPEQEFLGDD